MSLLNPIHGSASYCITSRIGPLIEINKVTLPVLELLLLHVVVGSCQTNCDTHAAAAAAAR